MARLERHWALGLNDGAVLHLQQMKVPATSVDVVLLATDGFTRLIDFYGLYTPESLLGAARERGVGALCRELRDLEDSDTECRRYPRLKPKDDATALLLKVAG